MADGYPGVSPYGYGPMQAPASGFANFMTGALPGLDRGAQMLAQMPLLKLQAEEMQRKQQLQNMQTLFQAMNLEPNLRGPYLDAIAPQLGLPETTVAMLKRMNEEQVATAQRAVSRIKGVPPEVQAALVNEIVKNPAKLVELYTAQTKREAQEEETETLRGIMAGGRDRDVPPAPPAPPPVSLTPSGTEPFAGLGGPAPTLPMPAPGGWAPPPAPPSAHAGALPRLEETLHRAEDPALGPNAKVITLRGALRAVDEAEAAQLDDITTRYDQIVRTFPHRAKEFNEWANSQRETIKARFAPRRAAITKRLEDAQKELEPVKPDEELGKLHAGRARAVKAGDAAAVQDYDRRIAALTETPEEKHARNIAYARAHAGATAEAGARARLGVPDKPTATERDKMVEDAATLSQAGEIRGLYKPDYVGPARGRIPSTALSVAGRALPGEADFRSALAIYRNRVINALSGAAVSASEAARMQQQIPQETDPPDVFEAKLRQTEQNLTRVAHLRREYYGRSGVSLGDLPPLPALAPAAPAAPATPAAPAAPARSSNPALDSAREKLRRRRQGVPTGG